MEAKSPHKAALESLLFTWRQDLSFLSKGGAPIPGPVPHIFRAVTLAASFLLFKYLIQLNIKPLPSPNYNWIDSLQLWGPGLVLSSPTQAHQLSGNWGMGWRRGSCAGEGSESGEVSEGPVCRGGVWPRGGVREEPGRGRYLEVRLLPLTVLTWLLGAPLPGSSLPALLPCPDCPVRERPL